MKKALIILVFLIVNSVFTSCTADEIPTTSNTQLTDSGGQSGELPVTPPKP
jgi:hypothetical protein